MKKSLPGIIIIMGLTIISAYGGQWNIGLDYNLKPNAGRVLNWNLSGRLPLTFLDKIQLGLCLDIGFYIPDFEENEGPLYALPKEGQTAGEVRLNGAIAGFTFTGDWWIYESPGFINSMFNYYCGIGGYFSGPGYYELGARSAQGLSFHLINYNAWQGDLYLEISPTMGIEFTPFWFTWDIPVAVGFRAWFNGGKSL